METKLSRIAFVFSFLFCTIAFGGPNFGDVKPVQKPAPVPVAASASQQDTSCVGQPNGTRCALSCGVGASLVLGKCINGVCIIPKRVESKPPTLQQLDSPKKTPKVVKATNVCETPCIVELKDKVEVLRRDYDKLRADLLAPCPPDKKIEECTEIKRLLVSEIIGRIQPQLNTIAESEQRLKKQVEDMLADLERLRKQLDGLPGRIDLLTKRMDNMVSSITELARRITELERRLQVDVALEVGPTFTGGASWFEGRLVLTLRYRVHDRVDLVLRGGLGLWTRPEDRTALSVAGAAGVAVWFDQNRRFGLLLGGIFSSRLIPGLQTLDEAQLNPAQRSWMAGGMAEFRYHPTKMLYLFVDVKGGYTSTFLANPARLYRGGEADLSAGLGFTF